MNASTWNQWLCRLNEPHILQTWEWGEHKALFGWTPSHHAWFRSKGGDLIHTNQLALENGEMGAAALVLQRRLPAGGLFAGFNVAYIPKGPLIEDWSDQRLRLRVLSDLVNYASQSRAIFIKIDPDVRLGVGIPGTINALDHEIGLSVLEDLQHSGWQYSSEQIQYKNTIIIDISQSEESLLAKMKQKTRYNIHLASRRGVKVRQGSESDFLRMYQMYAETSIRDGFVIRSEEYYQRLWKSFLEAGFAYPLIAEVNGEPVAGLFLFCFSKKGWYLFGMSTQAHRELMPNYLLQWEAMLFARDMGCKEYDLWGAPDIFQSADPLWNVYRFKEGLGGQVVRHIGAWDYPINPLLYKLYTHILPRILNWMRARGKVSTRHAIHQAI